MAGLALNLFQHASFGQLLSVLVGEDGRYTYKGEKLQEVMFGNREFMTHDYCAVLSNDINQQWRGNEFEPAIRVLIDKLGDEAFSGDATGSGQ